MEIKTKKYVFKDNSIFTQKIPLKTLNLKKEVRDSLEKNNIDVENGFILRKGYSISNSVIEGDDRTTVDYITTKDIDRSNEIVLPQGVMLDQYTAGNNVVLWAHKYDEMPLGRCQWVKSDGKGLIAKTEYVHAEANPKAEQMWQYRKAGFPMGKSIGFIPMEYIDREDFNEKVIKSFGLTMDEVKYASRIYTKSMLLEYSDTPVPANPACVSLAVKSGIIEDSEVKDFGFDIELISEDETKDAPQEKAKIIGHIDLDFSGMPNTLDGAKFISLDTKCVDCEDCGNEEVIEPIQEDNEEKSQDSIENVEEKAEESKKPCKKEDGECPGEDCENYGDCDEEMKKQFIETSVDKESTETISEQVEEAVIDEEIKSELDEIIEESFKEIEEENIETKEEDNQDSIQKTIDLFNSMKVKNLTDEMKEQIKKQSDFDVTDVKTEPASFEYKIFCKYLGCKIKNIFPTQFFIPSAMKGNYLSAFKKQLSVFNLLDQRNFYGNGGEIPLRFQVVKLNSKMSEEFLIDGTQFYESEDKSKRFVTQVYPAWGGVILDIYTTKDEEAVELNKSIVNNAVQWVKENNYLKGEKFSITGDFIEKTGMDWNSVIFPSDGDKSILMKNMDRLSKNSNGRGIMLIGPPGTGKTMTGKVLMEQEDVTFIWASSKDFGWGVNSALALGFDMARDLAPSILFLEDIDSWIRNYTVDLLKTEMDGIRSNKGVLTILTSNFPEDIPDALIDRPGRFHHIINFSLPNKENRIKLLKFFAENADKEIIEKFADMTEGYSGSHLKELVDFAKMISEDEEISINDALLKSFEQMKEQRQLIHDIKNQPKKKEFIDIEEVELKNFSKIDFEIKDTKPVETIIDFEIKETKQNVDFNITKEEAQEIIKKSITNVAKEMQSIESLVDERIKRAKGIIF